MTSETSRNGSRISSKVSRDKERNSHILLSLLLHNAVGGSLQLNGKLFETVFSVLVLCMDAPTCMNFISFDFAKKKKKERGLRVLVAWKFNTIAKLVFCATITCVMQVKLHSEIARI